MNYLIFFSTFETKRQAERFAKFCIENNLAACINIMPQVQSHYRWQGKICKSKEVLIMGKTTKKKLSKIKRDLKAIHPYDVPELIAIKLADGHLPYLKWISESVTS